MIRYFCDNKSCEYWDDTQGQNCSKTINAFSSRGLIWFDDFCNQIHCQDAIIYKKQMWDIPFYNKYTGHVYIIRIKDDIYKIGQTQNLPKRLKTLKSQFPEEILLYRSIESKDIILLEYLLHKAFDYAKIKGEFFKIKIEDLNKTINKTIDRMDTHV